MKTGSDSGRTKRAHCAKLRHRSCLANVIPRNLGLALQRPKNDHLGIFAVCDLPILAGECNPHMLAALRDRRIKASADTIAKSLVGDDRREHLFTLCQSLAAFRHYQELIAACDREIAQYLEGFESKVDPALRFPIALERRVPTEDERAALRPAVSSPPHLGSRFDPSARDQRPHRADFFGGDRS